MSHCLQVVRLRASPKPKPSHWNLWPDCGNPRRKWLQYYSSRELGRVCHFLSKVHRPIDHIHHPPKPKPFRHSTMPAYAERLLPPRQWPSSADLFNLARDIGDLLSHRCPVRPDSLSPQVHTVPSALIAIECWYPPATTVTELVMPKTCTGTFVPSYHAAVAQLA